MDNDTEKRGPGRPRKRLPVLIVRGHWPSHDFCRIEPGPQEEFTPGTKALKGWKVELDPDEARRIVQAGIAVRADDF